MKASPSVTVIIVSFNTRDMTLACLRSVFDQTSPAGCEVIVIDNMSNDGSADAIAAEFPALKLLRSEENLGFARANNVVATGSQSDYLLLLNPDTVVRERAIEKLIAFAEREPERGIWGGRTIFADGTLNAASCWRRQTLWSVFCIAAGLSSVFRGSSFFNPEAYGGWLRDSQRDVDIVSGCFLLIRRELWTKLGGFDRSFFMYGEEADLCLRAKKYGARPAVTPEALIVHYGGASERVRADKMVRLLTAKTLLIRRHWHPKLRTLGVLMLSLWPLTRGIAWTGMRLLGSSAASTAGAMWWSVWQRRREWVGTSATDLA